MATKKTGYVDGFVFIVPKTKIAAYTKMAKEGKAFWMKYGAIDYKECMGEDLVIKPSHGMKQIAFPKLANAKKGDTVWFSYITYKSRAHRDQVNAKVMKDMDKKYAGKEDMPMPFDPAKMAYGGFKVVI